jgi:hypothetical protein
MAIFPANVGRQYPLVTTLKIVGSDITLAKVASGVAIANAFDLPNEYIVLRGFVYVKTVFDGTTNTITLGDTGSATRFLNAVDLKTAATTEFSGVPFHSSTIGSAIAELTWTGTPTAVGEAYVVMEYIIPGRALEVQTN